MLAGCCGKEIKTGFQPRIPRIKSCPKTGPKKCGLLIFPGRLPQAPSRRQSAAPLLLLFNCVTNVTPFPQKSQTLALNSARGCLPQSLHSPQFSEPDPIYPYLPFLFWFSSLATNVPTCLMDQSNPESASFVGNSYVEKANSLSGSGHKSHKIVHVSYKRDSTATDNRSVPMEGI
jgi:hypothetical protein